MPVTTAGVEKLVWALIYGGLLTASVGAFLQRESDPVGWTLVGFGGAAVAAGALLIWLRSRMRGDTAATTTAPAAPAAAAEAPATTTDDRSTTR